ncbi:hypothetical protein GQX73_g6555 [Xylaria multiplex]|uniref:Uncharacterized protein n=1 Tax=Xylaria multiplex TaxID=323545 RepID=A0A7C8MRP0_9PEZI|nr:hypothetical protein GQX73_g6555 [Xylaria multiplex]
MRKLSRLEFPLEYVNALCFLCLSRAIVETADRDQDEYIMGFNQDLAKWVERLPGIKDICRRMWKIDWGAIPQLQRHFSAKLEKLRESVAELLVRVNTVLGRKPHGADQEHLDKLRVSSQQRRTNIEQGSLATESPDPPPTARQKKPPDRNSHEDKPLLLTVVVVLVTSIIFALVVYFIASSFIFIGTVVMLPNPWQNPPSQDATNFQATPLETYPPSHPRVATQPCPSTDPMTLDEEFPETVSPQHLELSPRPHYNIPCQSLSI